MRIAPVKLLDARWRSSTVNVLAAPREESLMRITEYRVVETSTVTDEALTRILNTESKQGWVLDGMTFVPNEASKRPRMAFVIFTRERDVDEEAIAHKETEQP